MNISDGISLVAVTLAFISVCRTRKQNEIENKLNETATKLAQLQLEVLKREEEETNSADVEVYFYLDETSNYRVAICNKGKAIASNVTFKLNVSGEERSPLIEEELNSKFPAASLSPDEEIYLIAAITIDMNPVFDAVISWENPDGKSMTKSLKLSLPR